MAFTLKPIIIYILILLKTFYLKNCSREGCEASYLVLRNTIKATLFITGYVAFGLQQKIGLREKKDTLEITCIQQHLQNYLEAAAEYGGNWTVLVPFFVCAGL